MIDAWAIADATDRLYRDRSGKFWIFDNEPAAARAMRVLGQGFHVVPVVLRA